MESKNASFLTCSFPEIGDFSQPLTDYSSLHRFSVENSDEFWGKLARTRLDWFQDFTQVYNGAQFTDADFQLKWFVDGKMNVSVNCVDRHYFKNPQKVALIWEKDEPGTQEHVTYE
jgi:acetyl-CoA synthetase